jgi:hypothetical protein
MLPSFDFDDYVSDTMTDVRGTLDPEWGDASTWGPTWDEDVWELGPEPTPWQDDPDDEPLPLPDDDDRASAEEACRWSDRLDAMKRAEDHAFERQMRWGAN